MVIFLNEASIRGRLAQQCNKSEYNKDMLYVSFNNVIYKIHMNNISLKSKIIVQISAF